MPEPCEVGRVCGYIFFPNIIHEHTCTHGPGKYMGRTPRLGTRRPWRLGPAGAILEGLGRSFNLLRTAARTARIRPHTPQPHAQHGETT